MSVEHLERDLVEFAGRYEGAGVVEVRVRRPDGRVLEVFEVPVPTEAPSIPSTAAPSLR